MLSGRSEKMSWGVTYPFLDGIDSWVEKCKDEKYYREDEGQEDECQEDKGQEDKGQWVEFTKRVDVIKRKKKDPFEITFYENQHGVLEGDPGREGYYLCTRWAPADGGAFAYKALLGMWDTDTVPDAMESFGLLSVSHRHLWGASLALKYENYFTTGWPRRIQSLMP